MEAWEPGPCLNSSKRAAARPLLAWLSPHFHCQRPPDPGARPCSNAGSLKGVARCSSLTTYLRDELLSSSSQTSIPQIAERYPPSASLSSTTNRAAFEGQALTPHVRERVKAVRPTVSPRHWDTSPSRSLLGVRYYLGSSDNARSPPKRVRSIVTVVDRRGLPQGATLLRILSSLDVLCHSVQSIVIHLVCDIRPWESRKSDRER